MWISHIHISYIEAKDLEEAIERPGLKVEKGGYFPDVYRAYNRISYTKGISRDIRIITGLSYGSLQSGSPKRALSILVILLLLIRHRMTCFLTSGMWKIWYDQHRKFEKSGSCCRKKDSFIWDSTQNSWMAVVLRYMRSCISRKVKAGFL